MSKCVITLGKCVVTMETVARCVDPITLNSLHKIHPSTGWSSIMEGTVKVVEIQPATNVPKEAGEYIAEYISDTDFWSEEIAETLSGYFIGFEYVSPYLVDKSVRWLPLDVFSDHVTIV